METIVLNGGVGSAVRRSINGRAYLVAPLTMIVPGVLNGSRGALYYPPEEVSRDPSIWDGVPLLLNHPPAGRTGRHPEVLDRQGLGSVFNSHYDGSRLRGEGWFDLEVMRRDPYRSRVADLLLRNERIELSTGLYTDNQIAENGATDPRSGKPYKYIARNYRADHLAILLDQRGACSVRDGCGVYNAASDSLEMTPEKACILPGQAIEGRVLAASEAFYSGKAVNIRAASGQAVSVTANHPVLTHRGFVPAYDIRKGDYLLCYVREDEAARPYSYKEYIPALVENAFESFLAAGGFQERSRAGCLDFHGDAAFFDGDVHIVRADGLLRRDRVPDGAERLGECDLVREEEYHTTLPSRRGLSKTSLGLLSPQISHVSGSDYGLPLLLGHQLPAESACLVASSEDSGFLEFPIYDCPADANPVGDGVRGLPGRVSLDDLCQGGVGNIYPLAGVEGACYFGSGSELDVPGLEPAADDGRRGSVLARKLRDRFPGQVVLDHVVAVDAFHYSGPVYDFQSPLGYILLEKLIIGNCKILKDGTVHGKPLTKAQRGMFGAKCGQRADNLEEALKILRS